MVQTSTDPLEPAICGNFPKHDPPFSSSPPAISSSPFPPTTSRKQFSWPVYAISAVLFLVATASSTVAAPSPVSPIHALARRATATAAEATGTCACKTETSKKHTALFAVEATMIPVLVILSGIFAGLTLGYMSLDSTQLNVLAKTGTAKQQYYAKRVIPIRKDGHLLLITLLLANMIVNETLPVIADGVLGGGVQAVVISTVLVVIFSEIIPQSVCSRFGLAIGSAMVGPVQVLIWCFYIVSWPVARLLQYLLGAHSGVVYRRAELKELINMHSGAVGHGGDLQQDTVTIVGATLDLQTKVVSDAMTPLSQIFQLPITSVLDYETLGRVLKAGHSRIPVYEEVEFNGTKKNKVIGVLLTKQLILLDPEDATPLANIPMNPLPTVSEDLPLLQILNTFQEGRSHMAIVCRRKAGFNPLGARLSQPIPQDGFAKESLNDKEKAEAADSDMEKGEVTGEQSLLRSLFHRKNSQSPTRELEPEDKYEKTSIRTSFSHSDDDSPIGVITLEDVLEELIGEEIYDETDRNGTDEPALKAYIPPEAVGRLGGAGPPPAPSAGIAAIAKAPAKSTSFGGGMAAGPISSAVGQLKGMVRSRSAPGKGRNAEGVTSGVDVAPTKDAATSTSLATAGGAQNTQVAEPESLSLIRERSTSAEDESGTDGGESTATAVDAPLGILAPANLLRSSVDTAGSLPYPRPAPPLLSDAVLLERGRRLLVAQGVDPTALPNLRLATPRSQPPSRSGTPPAPGSGRLVVPPPQTGAQAKKGSFKSPPLAAPIPLRHQSAAAVQTLASTSAATPKVEMTEDEKRKAE